MRNTWRSQEVERDDNLDWTGPCLGWLREKGVKNWRKRTSESLK